MSVSFFVVEMKKAGALFDLKKGTGF